MICASVRAKCKDYLKTYHILYTEFMFIFLKLGVHLLLKAVLFVQFVWFFVVSKRLLLCKFSCRSVVGYFQYYLACTLKPLFGISNRTDTNRELSIARS